MRKRQNLLEETKSPTPLSVAWSRCGPVSSRHFKSNDYKKNKQKQPTVKTNTPPSFCAGPHAIQSPLLPPPSKPAVTSASAWLPLGSQADLPLNFTTLFMQLKAHVLNTTGSTAHLWDRWLLVWAGEGLCADGLRWVQGKRWALSLGVSLSEFFPRLTHKSFFLLAPQFNGLSTLTCVRHLGTVLGVGEG